MKKELILDIPKIRKDFPILSRTWKNEKGEPVSLVYLDNAATTQKPLSVIQILEKYYTHYNANIHRALHRLGEEATSAYEEARAKVARFIGASSPKEIVFTRGTTDAINGLASSFGRAFLREKDEILLTEMEHHSNLVPWHFLKKGKGVVLRFIPLLEDGTLDISQLDQLMTEKTKLVSLVHMSNVLGTINPVKEIIAKAHERNIPVLLDGAQSVPHMPINVQELDCEFLAFSAHKLCGPTGIGVLYGKKEWLDRLPPYQGGGEMIRSVWLDHSTYNEIPHKFEAGTPPVAQAIGLGAAIDYLEDMGMDKIFDYEKELVEYAIEALSEIKGITFYGTAKERGSLISFGLEKIHPHDIAQFLDYHGIAIRAGHHCAQPIMRKLGIPATARASFYFYNERSEIQKLVESLWEVQKFFSF